MRILHSESFKKITPLLRDNYGNLQAQLSLKLPPDMAAMFARFTLQPSSGGAQWSVSIPEEDELRPFSKASDLERDQISMAIKRVAAELHRAFPAQADKIIEVPDNDSIFFAYSGRRMLVVLAQWGFRRVHSQTSTSIIRLCLERAEGLSDAPVTLRVINSDGTPAANKDFVLLVFNNEVAFTTDDMGLFNVGHLKAGSQFRVRFPSGDVTEAFTVEQGREFYDIRLQMLTSLTVNVVDLEGNPCPGVTTYFGGRTAVTDEAGAAHFEDIPFSGKKEVEVQADGCAPGSLTLQAEADENVITLSPAKPPQEPEKPEEKTNPEPPQQVMVRIVDKKGRPQGGLPVMVYCQQGYEDLTTDSDGWITLNPADLIPGEKPRIELMRPKAKGRRAKKNLKDKPVNPKADNNNNPAKP